MKRKERVIGQIPIEKVVDQQTNLDLPGYAATG